MRLAGIKNHIGKDRHDLLELRGKLQESFVQPAHLGPETHPRHGEVALHALFQVIVQTAVLLRRELEAVGDVDGVGGRVAGGEVGRIWAQPHLVRNNADAALPGHPTGGRLGIEHAVEHRHGLGLGFIAQPGKLPADVIGRKQILAVQRSRRRVIQQVVTAQHPADGRQRQRAQRHAVVFKRHQLRQRAPFQGRGQSRIQLKREGTHIAVRVHRM